MMNWVKQLMLLFLISQFKKLFVTKIEEIEEKMPNHDKYITANEFDK